MEISHANNYIHCSTKIFWITNKALINIASRFGTTTTTKRGNFDSSNHANVAYIPRLATSFHLTFHREYDFLPY